MRHCRVGAGAPAAAMVKTAVLPLAMVFDAGWRENEGGAVIEVTVSAAALLVTEPAELVATQVKLPASAGCALASVSVALVWPGSAAPFFCHCNVGAGEPVVATVNTTVVPAFTVWLVGFAMKAGATAAPSAMTKERVASREKVPSEPVTFTV